MLSKILGAIVLLGALLFVLILIFNHGYPWLSIIIGILTVLISVKYAENKFFKK